MKKLLAVITIFVLFFSMSMTTAIQTRKYTNFVDPDGSFSGYIGYLRLQQDPVILGNISGVYKIRNRGGGFNASWDIDYQNKSGSGTVKGIFGRYILLGRLSVEGFNKTLPIIGFIGFNTENQTFLGRAMSIIGPALHFWGTYEPY